MKCPACNATIPTYKVAMITRWSGVRCRACRRDWGRKLDAQIWSLGFAFALTFMLVYEFTASPGARVGGLAIAAVAMIMIDAATIKLVPFRTKKSRGTKIPRAKTPYRHPPPTSSATAASCPSCDTANDHDAAFCKKCGAKLASTCSACDARNDLDAAFCKKCGTELA